MDRDLLARHPWVLVSVLLVLALAFGSNGGGTRSTALSDPLGGSLPSESPAPASPGLAVDPTSWWTVAGNTTGLSATWVGIPAGCTASPLWYRWSVQAGWDEGTLAPSETASTNFTAASVATGVARIGVNAATTVTCGASETAVDREATANVTVVVPPELQGLTVYPDPASAGAATELNGTLWGGAPPYRLTVAWGEGNVSTVDLSAPGAFALSHAYAAGNYSPEVFVEDSAGLSSHASAEETVYVSGGLAVGVETESPIAEVGEPVDFTGAIVHPPSSFSDLESCTDSRSESSGGGGPGPNESFSCAFASPGLAEVEYEVIPINDGYPATEATLTLPVVSPLAVSVRLDGNPEEVDRPTVASVNLSGGVAPFSLSWQLSSNASEQTATVTEDGLVVVSVWPQQPGTFGLTVRVVDALGTEVENGSVRLSVDSSLNASANVAGVLGPAGSVVHVAGSVPGGQAPFVWFVAPASVPSNESPTNGTLSTVSIFSWSGTLPYEGRSSVTVGVVDADGAFWWATYPVGLVPPLVVSAALGTNRTNGSAVLSLNLTVEGGLPPFALWTNGTEGLSRNGSLPTDTTLRWSFVVNRSGPFEFNTTVLDRLGARAYSNTSATVSLSATPPPPSPSPAPPPPSRAGTAENETTDSAFLVAGGSVVAVLLAASVAFLWRWHKRRPAPSVVPPDPVAVLREIIEPADGAERSTVELLAEERGIPLETVRSTLDRLITDGTVRAETGSDGEEVVAWSSLGPP